KTHRTASSRTDCKEQPLLFQDLGSRKVVADFSGDILSSDGGLLLLRQVDRGLGIPGRDSIMKSRRKTTPSTVRIPFHGSVCVSHGDLFHFRPTELTLLDGTQVI